MSGSAFRRSGTTIARVVGSALLVVLTTVSVIGASPPPAAASTSLPPVTRLDGADRYATAVAVSHLAFEQGAANVVLVNGGSFADAMAAAPAAGVLHAPVLPVQAGAVPSEVAAEVRRLGATTALVVGGPSAVGDAVVSQFQRAGLRVARAHGADRYETAAAVARRVVAVGTTGPDVLLASGEGFADALVGGAYGSATGRALLLTQQASLSAAAASALRDLRPRSVTVLGGSGAIADSVLAAVAQHTSAPVRRIQGTDRFGTAAAAQEELWASAPAVLLATGETFPDALASAALGVPLLLTRSGCLPQETARVLTTWRTTNLVAVGGAKAVSDAAAARSTCLTP